MAQLFFIVIILLFAYINIGYAIGKLSQYVREKILMYVSPSQRWWMEILDFILWPYSFYKKRGPRLLSKYAVDSTSYLKLITFVWPLKILGSILAFVAVVFEVTIFSLKKIADFMFSDKMEAIIFPASLLFRKKSFYVLAIVLGALALSFLVLY